MEEAEYAEKYHKVMSLIREANMEHGLCKPRERRSCTACNAKDDLEKMVAEYKVASAVLLTPNAELTGRASAACEGPR